MLFLNVILHMFFPHCYLIWMCIMKYGRYKKKPWQIIRPRIHADTDVDIMGLLGLLAVYDGLIVDCKLLISSIVPN